jgi:ATP-dependent RNA helicase DDX55/SPB4
VTADIAAFQRTGANLWIGTPGRVQDILKYNINCADLEYLVLDEADVLLNMGFSQTLQQILAKLPKMRRTGLFSATTANDSLKEWMHRVGMRDPVWIDVAVTKKTAQEPSKQATPSTLTNYYMVTPLDEKLSRLAAFLQDHKNEKMIVFFLTCACVEFFGSALKQILTDVNIELLHGKLIQKRREKALERFRSSGGTDCSSSGGALFCTDVAARGLDVTDIDWVVQFDAPQDPSFFIHRAGRTARAGRQGKSLLLLTRKEEAYIDFLQMRKVPLEPMMVTERSCPPGIDDVNELDAIASSNERTDWVQSSGNDRLIQSAVGPDVVIQDMLPKVKELALTDRDMLEKGTKAFTSYIRAYKEHHCAFIFR